jgi:hypothetical protein
MRRSTDRRYSMTSSARASSVAGTLRPSASAVLRLMAKTNFVGSYPEDRPGFSRLMTRCGSGGLLLGAWHPVLKALPNDSLLKVNLTRQVVAPP